MDYYYFGSSWIVAQRAAQQLGLETESLANRIDFGSETSVLVLFRVSHTGSPLDLHSFISYIAQGIDCCRTRCSHKGGFQPESPNQLLGL